MAAELELKFSSPEGRVPDAAELTAALAPLGLGADDLGAATQADLYYDDASLVLQRAGLALRVRSLHGQRLATLKSRGSVLQGLHERDEVEVPLPGDAPPPWPQAVAQLLPGNAQDGLAPHMLITTVRHAFTVRRGGQPVAELAFDEVRAGPAAQVSLQYAIDEARFDEVELEALPGGLTGAQLRQVGAALQELLPLYPSDISKLERAASLLAPFAG
jgi:inorganic triphosphatase YgiF